MTTYTNIPDEDIDQDSPVTQPLLTSLRDNPVATAEGAAGAPKVQNVALQGLYLGFLTLEYTFGQDGSNPEGFNDLGNFEQLVFDGLLWNDNGDQVRIRFSSDNGSSWGAWQPLLDGDNDFRSCVGTLVITKQSQLAHFAGVAFDTASSSGGQSRVEIQSNSLTIPLSANAFQIRDPYTIQTEVFVFMTGGR